MTSRFGLLLRQWRQRAGLSQEALAHRATVGVRTVRGLETGERTDPRMGTVRALADALELTGAERAELFAAAGRDEPPPVAEPVRFDPLHEAVETLKVAIEARWRREEEQRQVHDPVPLPVRWEPAPARLRDSGLNIGGDVDLGGRLDQVVEVYRRVPSRRLVVLGRAGAGKTVLTTRFVLDLLAARDPADPVPVIFGLGSWHPGRVGLRDWMAEQLIREHPFLAAPGPSGTLASALVDSQRVLPVLDGFDEIAAGLHRPALVALNATTLPLLLTSRVDEYRDAVEGTDVLTSAAAVVLAGLTADDLAGYLPRTTRKTGPGGNAWQPVLDEVRAGGPLAEVLTTPLMVSLARRVYSDTPDHDPAELLSLGTPDEIERHLLSSFAPAVYGPARAARVRPWLAHLAEHLTRLGTHDVAWWRFGTSARVTGLAVGVAVGLSDLVVESLLLGERYLQIALFAVMIAVVTGVLFGLAHRIVMRRTPLRPVRTRLRLRGRLDRRAGLRALLGLGFGGAAGAAYGLVRTLAYWLVTPEFAMTAAVLVDVSTFTVVFGLGAGLVFGVVAALEAPLDVRAALSPAGVLRSNRRAVLLLVAMMVPVFTLFVAFSSGIITAGFAALGFAVAWSLPTGLLIGFVGGVVGGLAYVLSLTAWGQWVVFARVWLPLTGRLPWRLSEFLDDAYRRGVLRRAGAVYQFRHARLQEHFARSR